jgi:hypothetical protein
MKNIILLAIMTVLATPAFAESFFTKGQEFIDTKRDAEGYIEEVASDGKLQVMFLQGRGSYNSYRTVVTPDAVAKKEGCSSQGIGCVNDRLLVKVSNNTAIVLPISGIMPDGAITIGRKIVSTSEIANLNKGQCVQSTQSKVCIGDKVVIPGENEVRKVMGIFSNGEIAVYDKTIYSNNVRWDYFKTIKAESLQ